MDRAIEIRRALAVEIGRPDVGQAVAVAGQSPVGTYDPATQTTAAGTPASDVGLGRVGSYQDRDIDGSRVLATDRRITWQPADWSFVPAPGMTAAFGGETLSIVSVKKRELGGVPFCYTLQVR